MNRFMIETELDDLGRPVRSWHVYLNTFAEFQRAMRARERMQGMLARAQIRDDTVCEHVLMQEMS